MYIYICIYIYIYKGGIYIFKDSREEARMINHKDYESLPHNSDISDICINYLVFTFQCI